MNVISCLFIITAWTPLKPHFFGLLTPPRLGIFIMMSLADKRLSKNPPSPFHGRVSAFSEGIVKHQLLDRGWGRPLKIKKAHCTLPEWSVHRVERIKWISQQIGPDLMNSQSHQKWVCKSVKRFVGFYIGMIWWPSRDARRTNPSKFTEILPPRANLIQTPLSIHSRCLKAPIIIPFFNIHSFFCQNLASDHSFNHFLIRWPIPSRFFVLWNPIKIWNLFRCVVQWIVRHHLKHW